MNAPNPQPRQIWYAWVPFDEMDGGKDRPCLVVDRDGDLVTVLKITHDARGRAGYIRIPTRSWDPGAASDSWLRLGRPVQLTISDGAFRRRAGSCDSATWRVATSGYRRDQLRTRGRAVREAVFAGMMAAVSGLCGLSYLLDPEFRAVGVVALIVTVLAGLVCVERVGFLRDSAGGRPVPAIPSPPPEPAPAGGKRHGTVAWFDHERGYGFIDADDGTRAFVHHSAIRMGGYRTLDEGQRVSFRPVPSDRGPRAEDVHPLD